MTGWQLAKSSKPDYRASEQPPLPLQPPQEGIWGERLSKIGPMAKRAEEDAIQKRAVLRATPLDQMLAAASTPEHASVHPSGRLYEWDIQQPPAPWLRRSNNARPSMKEPPRFWNTRTAMDRQIPPMKRIFPVLVHCSRSP